VDERLGHDVRVVELLDQAEEQLRAGSSLHRMGFNDDQLIAFQEVRDRVAKADASLGETDWQKVF